MFVSSAPTWHEFSCFPPTFTTMPLYHRSLRRFETSFCQQTPRGLPSSLSQPRGTPEIRTVLFHFHTQACRADRLYSTQQLYSGFISLPSMVRYLHTFSGYRSTQNKSGPNNSMSLDCKGIIHFPEGPMTPSFSPS